MKLKKFICQLSATIDVHKPFSYDLATMCVDSNDEEFLVY